jgi:hypothetical protein
MLTVGKHLALLPECVWQDKRPPTPAGILRFTQDDMSAFVILTEGKHLALLPECHLRTGTFPHLDCLAKYTCLEAIPPTQAGIFHTVPAFFREDDKTQVYN